MTRGNHDSDLDGQINSCIDNFRIKYPNAYSGKSWKLIEKALKTQKIKKKKKKKDSRTLTYYYRKLFQTDIIEISKIDSAIKIHFVS